MSGKTQSTETSTANKTPAKPATPQVEGMLDVALPSGATGIMDRIHADPRALSTREVLHLQRTVGNRSVNQLLGPRRAHGIQTKLTVGAAHDPYEQEADQVADQIMTMPEPAMADSPAAAKGSPHPLQRELEEEEDLAIGSLAPTITPAAQRSLEEDEELQTKRESAADSFEAGADFESRLSATRGSGSPLPAEVRAYMEPRFDADFSSVRIHANSEAAQLNREVSAQAFTHGQDIYLGEGKSDLASSEGQHLLAHELTHVVQQGGAVARKPVIRRALDVEQEVKQEEQPLSMEAALAEAQAEVTDADIAQESVTVDTTPIELPATNEIAGANVDADGGGAVAAPVAEPEPTAEATPAVAEEPTTAEPVAPTAEVTAATTEPAAPATPAEAVADATASLVIAQPSAVPTTPAAQVNVPTAETPAPTPVPSASTAEAGTQPIEPTQPNTSAAPTAKANAPAIVATPEPTSAAPAVEATTQPAAPATPLTKETQTAAPTGEANALIAEATAPQETAVAEATAQSTAAMLEDSARAAETELEDEDKDKLATVRRKTIGSTVQRQVAVAPKTPQEDLAFQQVVVKSKQAAKQEKAHEPPTTTSAKAQAASDPKGKDVEMAAQNRQVGEMQAQPAGTFDTAAFKAQLLEKVAESAPKTLKEADEFKNNNKIGAVKQSIAGEVKEEKEKAEGPIEEKAKKAPDKSGIPAKDVAALEKTDAGPKPTDPGAKDAAPKARTNAEVATPLQEESVTLDKQMSAANVTEEQLENSNEPAFKGALQSKKDAQKNAVEAPLDYRQGETAALAQAQNNAQATGETQAQETRSEKEQLLAQVFGMQGQTKGVDEGKRQEVANHISDIYLKTKQDVEKVLGDLDGEVNKRFDAGAEEAKRAFEGYVDQRMSKYKWDRYLSIPLIGLGQWVADQFMGLPPEVNIFYVEGRDVYLARMDSCLTGIANYIGVELMRAKQRVAEGKQEIQTYTAGLSPELQQVGREAAQKIQGKFDELDESVDSKQSELVDSLAQRYVEKSQELDARIEEMKLANSGLVNQAVQAIGGVIKTIQDLATMLGNVLQRAANAVSAILKDPIKFLSNLIDGVKQGLQRFVSNIGTHLQTGLMGWLTGALGGVITAFPKSFSDIKGILNMVLEIFGLTYARIRQNVVKGLGERGEEVMGALEKAWEIFQIIRTEGLGGLWEFIKDMVGDLKAMVIDQIQTMIAQEVIQAGIQWVVSLLGGPAGAFIKAAQAIIKIVMWFVNNGSKLLALVNSVIDSIAAIASGNVSAAAQYIENSLAKAVPLLIGFLADLLGLGGIAKKVQNIIAKIRAPIDKAIQWVVKKAVAMGKKLLAKLRFGKKGKDDKADEGKVAGEVTEPESVEIAFVMSGADHTLTLDASAEADVLMASANKGKLSQKIGQAIGKLKAEPQEGDIPERIEKLMPIGKKAKAVQSTLSEYKQLGNTPNKTEAQKSELGKLLIKLKNDGKEVAGDLTQFANDYGIKDLNDLLPDTYPGPVAGVYSALNCDQLPDGTTRERHHVPSKEVGKFIAQKFANVAGKVGAIDPQVSSWLEKSSATISAELGDKNGNQLPAILIHAKTHMSSDGDAVHSPNVAESVETWLKDTGTRSDPTGYATKANGDLSANAQNPHYENMQISNRVVKKYGALSTRLDRRKATKDFWKMSMGTYENTYRVNKKAVETALRQSKVDGSASDHRTALAQLDALQDGKWTSTIRSVFDDFPSVTDEPDNTPAGSGTTPAGTTSTPADKPANPTLAAGTTTDKTSGGLVDQYGTPLSGPKTNANGTNGGLVDVNGNPLSSTTTTTDPSKKPVLYGPDNKPIGSNEPAPKIMDPATYQSIQQFQSGVSNFSYAPPAGKPPAFWSGGMDVAGEAARQAGCATMEDTSGGQNVQTFTTAIKDKSDWSDQKPLWSQASSAYAHMVGKQYGGTGKPVYIFINDAKFNPMSVYMTVEKPILASYGVNIVEVHGPPFNKPQ